MEVKKKRGRGRPKLSDAEKKARAQARLVLKKEKEKEKTQKLAEKIKAAEHIILTPAGKCPIPLLSTEEESVKVWLKNISTLKIKGKQTVQSVCYWLRDYYNVNSKEYADVKSIIKDNCHDFGIKDYELRLNTLYKKITLEKGE